MRTDAAILVVLIVVAYGEMARGQNESPANETPPPHAVYLKTLADHDIPASGDGAVEYLRQLHPTPQRKKEIAALVGKLGDSSYSAREAAMRELLRQPSLPLEALNTAADGSDPEVRWRARHILKESQARSADVLFAAMKVIATEQPDGAAKEILLALPLCREAHLQTASLDAMRKAAKPADRTVLAEAMRGESPALRLMAAAGLAATTAKGQERDLYPLLQTENGAIALEIAQTLADRGDRKSLDALVKLLGDDDTAVRSAAIGTLRGLTGEFLGYAAYDQADNRQAAVAKWRTWVADQGQTAELSFPVPRHRSARGDLGGHTLVATGGKGKVIEFDAAGKEVWSYSLASWNAEKLPNGNVLIGSYNTGKVVEVDASKNVVWEFPGIKAMTAKPLLNGNILVSDFNGSRVVEINRQKKIVWEHKTDQNCFDSDRLPNGNTIFGTPNWVKEVSHDHKVVRQWRIEGRLNGFHALPSGNILVANYGQSRVVELTPDNKQVWEFKENQVCDVFRLPNGHTLISSNHRVIELGADNKFLKEICKASYGSARR